MTCRERGGKVELEIVMISLAVSGVVGGGVGRQVWSKITGQAIV